ncbi:hypothetical protein OLMES_2432 [Oleiphilus messinensis]|uniref:Uncharacterized protein n=1 Tax=Oleiphilus messinensis TaxID=141451 RepID=A0A1Y0IAR8_9GAMM|nr:hypothetical protein [Oleiphilus messinensis]ARU56493.1 hypothetical protein OLMES_2432 [Oleiphilus messinensis]
MIKHSLKKTDRPIQSTPLVLEIEELKVETLQAIPQYLINNIACLKTDDSNYCARPVLLEVGSSLILSEYEFWSLVIKCGKETQCLTLDYLIQTFEIYGRGIPWTDEVDKLGQECLYAFFDELDYEECTVTEDSILLKLFSTFSLYFIEQNKGKGHNETTRLKQTLEGLISYNNMPLFYQTLYHAIQYGQGSWASVEGLLPFFHQDGVLKKLIDLSIEKTDAGDGFHERAIYLLCAVVYGSNEECTQNIINYYNSHFLLEPFSDTPHRNIARNRKVCDAYFQQFINGRSITKEINTGFHIYNTESRQWRSI